MLIDERIEEHVREAYRGAIGHDLDRMTGALAPLAGPDLATAIGYGLYVCARVVDDIYPDGVPPQGLLELARKIVDAEQGWTVLPPASTVADLLAAARRGDPAVGGLSGPGAAQVIFICGAHLLSRYRLADQRAWEYLDEIWNTARSPVPGDPDR